MELSPGLAQSTFELLRLVGRHGLTVPAMLDGLRRVGGMPSAIVLELAQTLNWVSVCEDGILAVTTKGERLIAEGGYASMLRLTLIDYAAIVCPPWLQNARHGRNRVLAFASIGIRQTLVEAGVAEGVEEDIVAFWDVLATLARGQRDERLLAIGRHGERLTLAYEERRTGSIPKWVAVDSNADGFDVLSILTSDDRLPLPIEVKTTTVGPTAVLTLTRREWDAALQAPTHLFHLWDVSRATRPMLAAVTVEEMADHMPSDCGQGLWQSVDIPFSTFSNSFIDS